MAWWRRVRAPVWWLGWGSTAFMETTGMKWNSLRGFWGGREYRFRGLMLLMLKWWSLNSLRRLLVQYMWFTGLTWARKKWNCTSRGRNSYQRKRRENTTSAWKGNWSWRVRISRRLLTRRSGRWGSQQISGSTLLRMSIAQMLRLKNLGGLTSLSDPTRNQIFHGRRCSLTPSS